MNSYIDKLLLDRVLNDKEFYNKIKEFKKSSNIELSKNKVDISIEEFVDLWKKYEQKSKDDILEYNSNKCLLDIVHAFVLVLKVIFITINFYEIFQNKYSGEDDMIISIIKYIFTFAFIFISQFDTYDIIKTYNEIYITLPKDTCKITNEYNLNLLLELEERDKLYRLQKIWYTNLFYKIISSFCWIIIIRSSNLPKADILLLTYIISCICCIGFITFVCLHQLHLLNTKQWLFRNKYNIFLSDPHSFIKVLKTHEIYYANIIDSNYGSNYYIESCNKFVDKIDNISIINDSNYLCNETIVDAYEIEDNIADKSINNEFDNIVLFMGDRLENNNSYKLNHLNFNEINHNVSIETKYNNLHELRYSFKDKAYSTPTISEYEKKIGKINVVVKINYCLVLLALTCTVTIYKHYYFLLPIGIMFINLFIPITYPILVKINILLIQLIVMILLMLKV